MAQARPYDRPFSLTERFLGYFTWVEAFSEFLGEYAGIHHGCHEDELQEALAEDALQPRSVWSTELSDGSIIRRAGVWCTFNYYGSSPKGNRFGPFLLDFPCRLLEGRRFALIQRSDPDRARYTFVQHEEDQPLLPTDPVWSVADPKAAWEEKHDGAIRDLILTTPLPLTGVRITPIVHRECAPGKCSGPRGQRYGREILNAIGMPKVQAILKASPQYTDGMTVEEVPGLLLLLPEYLALVRRFPDLASERLTLPSPLEGQSVLLPDPPRVVRQATSASEHTFPSLRRRSRLFRVPLVMGRSRWRLVKPSFRSGETTRRTILGPHSIGGQR